MQSLALTCLVELARWKSKAAVTRSRTRTMANLFDMELPPV
jgi:hypothetical protein